MSNERRTGLHIRIKGEKAGDAQGVAEVLQGIEGAAKAFAEALGEDPDKIAFDVASMGWVCDGCGRKRPEDHSDWTHRDGEDFCPACSSQQQEDGGR